MIYPRKNKSDFTEEEIDEIREMPGDEIIGIDEAGDPIYADEFFDDED